MINPCTESAIQSVHRKCHSIRAPKAPNFQFPIFIWKLKIENPFFIENDIFYISISIQNWKLKKKKFSNVLFHFNFKRKIEWHFRCTDYFRSFFNFQFWIEIEVHKNSLFHPNFKMKTEGHLRCTDFVLCYISKISIETKIKALFLISDFNLSKKRNDTSGARIYLFLN